MGRHCVRVRCSPDRRMKFMHRRSHRCGVKVVFVHSKTIQWFTSIQRQVGSISSYTDRSIYHRCGISRNLPFLFYFIYVGSISLYILFH